MFGRIRRVALACKPGKDRCHIGGDPGVDSEEIGNVRPAQAFGVPSRQEEIGDPARLVGVALSQRQESLQSCPGQLVHVYSSDGFDQTISTSVRLHGLLALDLRTSQERHSQCGAFAIDVEIRRAVPRRTPAPASGWRLAGGTGHTRHRMIRPCSVAPIAAEPLLLKAAVCFRRQADDHRHRSHF